MNTFELKKLKGYQIGLEIFVSDPRDGKLHEVRSGRQPTEKEWMALQNYLGRTQSESKDSRAQEEE